MSREMMVSQNSRLCETESLFPVLDETPICSEIRVCICRRV